MGKFRIKELAQARGMSQEMLAFKSGVKMRTVQRLWQNKIERASVDIMIPIADALGVDVKDLYAERSESYNPEQSKSLSLAAA
jgi:transcriptional regulator with XRE-family HTH domain